MNTRNYAVMRHASYLRGGQEITESGIDQIQKASEKLKKFLEEKGITEFHIWHSPQTRAENTAKILSSLIKTQHKIETGYFLDCGLSEIQNYLDRVGKTFILMISHEPDIEYYLKNQYGIRTNVDNCDIFYIGDRLE